MSDVTCVLRPGDLVTFGDSGAMWLTVDHPSGVGLLCVPANEDEDWREWISDRRREVADYEKGRPQGIPRDGEPQDRPSVSREGE